MPSERLIRENIFEGKGEDEARKRQLEDFLDDATSLAPIKGERPVDDWEGESSDSSVD